MNLPRQLYELQQIDLELQKKRKTLEEIKHQLDEPEVLVAERSNLSLQKQQLAEAEKKQRSIEWELEDLQAKGDKLNKKLYGGTVKNPKELVNLEYELRELKSAIRKKEDGLLDLMDQVEVMKDKVRISSKKLEELEQEWQERREVLSREETELETQLTSLDQKGQELRQQITPEVVKLYEETKLRKGQAVAKVEQGRCQGCLVTLPVAKWRQARGGELVQCGNCGRLLYLE
jgi:hypothetical protein